MDLPWNRTGKLVFFFGLAGVLTTLSLLSASNTYVANNGSAGVSPYAVSWRMALSWGFIQWYLWIPAIPLAMRLPRWVPLHGSVLKPVAAISTVGILAAAFHAGALFLIVKGAKWYLSYVMITDFLQGLLVFVAALAAAYAWTYYREARRGKLQFARLESQLAKANLAALRMQLNPHFLFNTLNTISSLQMSDPTAAQKMTAQLGDFLRMTLRASGDQEVALAEELEFVRRYLEIERVRFGNRLTVSWNVDPHLNRVMVPNLVLQPLVENAFRHGISEVVQGARLDISASADAGQLVLAVKDNGPGCADERVSEGVGFSNTRERLHQLYGDQAELHVGNVHGRGFLVTLRIPRRNPSAEATPPIFAHAH